jgi:uncharacterized protein YycO
MELEYKRRAKRYLVRAAQSLLAGGIAFGTLFAPFASPARAGEITPFNLSADTDKNGIADELETAISGMNTLAETGSEEQVLAAIKDFDLRLPYAEETRTAQSEIEKLQAELETADEKRALEIKDAIAVLDEKMKQDPAYVQTTEDLMVLLTPDELKTDSPDYELAGRHWASARQGDILLQFDYRSPFGYIYGMNYSHTGQLFDSGTVLESLANGVTLMPLSTWQEGRKDTAIARNRRASQSAVVNSMNARKVRHIDTQHTPYNFFMPDKWRDDRLYCSQLTWKIHRDIGYNLDSNNFWYHLYLSARYGPWIVPVVAIPAVAPDEIARSGEIRIVATGRN